MRIVLATGIYPPEIGGPATYAALIETELRTRGWEVDVLPFRAVRHLPSVIRHLAYTWRLFTLSRGARAILAQDTVSVGLPSALIAKLRGLPLVIRVPGDFAWEQSVQRFGVTDSIDVFQGRRYGWRVEALRRLQAVAVRSASEVMAPSAYFASLVAGWGVPTARVHAVYNGVSVPKDIIPQRHDVPTLVSAGRLVPWKGFDGLIRLMGRLPHEVRLLIIGDGPERERLERLAANLGVGDRVRFVGAVSREELLSHVAGATVFVLRSSFESFSFQLVEAMMLGVPVVAQAIGNLGEIVCSGEDGILLDPQDEGGLERAVRRLLADPAERVRLGAAAQRSSQRFSVSATADRVEALLRQAISRT